MQIAYESEIHPDNCWGLARHLIFRSFNDPVRAEEYARTLTNMQKEDEYGGKVYFKVEEAPEVPGFVKAEAVPVGSHEPYRQAVFEPVNGKPVRLTVKDAIEQAIRKTSGRAELSEIYTTVKTLKTFKSRTPLESIRFVENSDGTWSLGRSLDTKSVAKISEVNLTRP